MGKLKLPGGKSTDALLLTFVKLLSPMLNLVITRLLSEFLTVYDYGTYSQILLLVSTVVSLTTLGLIDGVNFFYCREPNPEKKEAYIATIFSFQCVVNTVAGAMVLVLCHPICQYFANPDVRRLLIFAAALPFLQNLLSLFQVLLVAVGKARLLALRNLLVSLLRLAAVSCLILFVQDVALVLLTTVVLDLLQVVFFRCILKKNRCAISLKKTDFRLLPQIFRYCVPMAVFVVVNTLSRDCDKYLIGLCTDTATLAIYSNASKFLPFDTLLTSFYTVLLPEFTRLLAQARKEQAAQLYRHFMELACISNGILYCAILAAAPQLMELFYSAKYLSGLPIFMIYILVDLFRFTNTTLILTAAGKTKTLMFLGLCALGVNGIANVLFFHLWGWTGPAVATLLTTVLLGLALFYHAARALQIRMRSIFRLKFLLRFFGESLILTALLFFVQSWMARQGVHYIVILALVCLSYCAIMFLLHGKRLLFDLKQINRVAAAPSEPA